MEQIAVQITELKAQPVILLAIILLPVMPLPVLLQMMEPTV